MMEQSKLRALIPRSENPAKWSTTEQGQAVMPELQSAFLDWLLTPESEREHTSIASWAKANGVNASTCGVWKKDPRFRREWEQRAAANNISVDRMQNVIETIYQAAVDRNNLKEALPAARLYMQYVEKINPPVVVERDNSVEHLTDDELLAEIGQLMADGL